MHDLTRRLAALDPEAGAALRVIAHFDSLTDSRAGLQSIVRGAAALAGCPAGLSDVSQHLTIRVLADGGAATSVPALQPEWPSTPVTPDGAVLWLERTGPAGTVDAIVLERAAGAARSVLRRTRSIRPGGSDDALLELVLDSAASEPDRLAAARRLGLSQPARVVAYHDGDVQILARDRNLTSSARAGVGPVVHVTRLPASLEAAKVALRLTAEGTEDDPGQRVVHAEDLGALPLLLRAADGESEPIADVVALQRAGAAAPRVLATLDAVAWAISVRDAARALQIHHSTLQARVTQAETLIGWNVRHPQGLLRLQLALLLRRAIQAPALPGSAGSTP